MSTTCCVCKVREGALYPKLSHVLKKPVCPACLSGCGGYTNKREEGLASPLPSFSIEFEIHGTMSACEKALVLLEHGYLRTIDVTVSDEYKSPIYRSLSAFRSHIPILHSLGHLVDRCCGTHLHVGFSSSLATSLSLMQQDIFGPLMEHLETNGEITRRFWGRSFCGYAASSFADDYPWLRFPTCYNTLEFRLPRFRDAAQYLEVVRFCRRSTYFLQQSLNSLKKLGDPYGEYCEAARLELTPKHLGNRLMAFYDESLSHLTQQYQRLSGTAHPPFSSAS